jgi:hypothetical protein
VFGLSPIVSYPLLLAYKNTKKEGAILYTRTWVVFGTDAGDAGDAIGKLTQAWKF